jgi:predicted HD superfamily hydrolase involved in NAD metabolism
MPCLEGRSEVGGSRLNQWQAAWDGINVAWFLPALSEDQVVSNRTSGERWNTTASEVHDQLRGILPPSVMEHSARTARLARALAVAHLQDAERAEIAGLVHDVADAYTDSQLLALAAKYGIAVDPIAAEMPRLLHGPVGAAILRFEWGVQDEAILTAVAEHVTGAVEHSLIAKLLFVADKLDAERDDALAGRSGLQDLAERDLDAALLQVASRRLEGLVARGKLIDERLVSARNRLLLRTRAVA